MSSGENLAELYNRTQNAARRLQADAAEILEMAQDLERLTKDTEAWYASTRARVEARAALEQVKELHGMLEELGERLGE